MVKPLFTMAQIRQAGDNGRKALNYFHTSIFFMQGEPIGFFQRWMIFLFVLGCGVAFLFLFSALPLCYGDKIYLALGEQYEWTWVAAAASLGVGVFMYVSDVWYWNEGIWRLLRGLMVFIMIGGLAVAALLATREYPVAPIGLFLFGAPFVLVLFRRRFFGRVDILAFVRTLEFALWLLFGLSLAAWVSWLAVADYWWNIRVKVLFYEKMNCEVALNRTIFTDEVLEQIDEETEVVLDNQITGCTSGFLLWILPLVLAMWACLFASVLFFMVRTLEQVRTADSASRAMDPLVQAFVMFVALGFLGIYAASGIAGAEMELTNVILALALLAGILTGVLAVAVFGWERIAAGLRETPLGQRFLQFVDSDWVRSFELLLLTIPFAVYVFLSFFTQISRKYFRCTKTLETNEKRYMFTAHATKVMKDVWRWRWSSVLAKSIYVGIFIFIFVVGVARVATVFLSWLNEALLTISLVTSTAIFWVVGIIMFLLPPVPGVPVYVAGGLILVSAARPSMGFWGANAFTIAICTSLKFTAIVCQQKVFGEYLASSRVSIRSLVAVNSIEVRAIRDILSKPGLSIPKVTILCGGPDWPTSVMTGILRLPLRSMLIGSTPIVFLIAPCVFAGATLLRKNESTFWSSVSTMTLLLAAVAQAGAMLAAVHFIAKTVTVKEDELRAMPPDEEVLELELRTERKRAVRKAIGAWNRIGRINQFLLASAALSMAVSVYVFLLLGDMCFETFDVDSSIEEDLGGDPLNIVKELGVIALGLFCWPTVFIIFYNTYMGYRAKWAMNDATHWANSDADLIQQASATSLVANAAEDEA